MKCPELYTTIVNVCDVMLPLSERYGPIQFTVSHHNTYLQTLVGGLMQMKNHQKIGLQRTSKTFRAPFATIVMGKPMQTQFSLEKLTFFKIPFVPGPKN